MSISRRTVLAGAGVLAAGATVGSPRAFAADRIPVIVDRTARAVIIRRPTTDAQLVEAANLLRAYVEMSTGVALDIVVTAQPDSIEQGTTRIYLGLADDPGLPDAAVPDGTDSSSFAITAGTGAITIVGRTSWGTRFGVFEFLERWVGIRWLMPGVESRDVPDAATIGVPAGAWQSTPAFSNRAYAQYTYHNWLATPWYPPGMNIWGAFIRSSYSVHFMHYLAALIPVAKYGDPNRPETYRPEFFPIRSNGEVYIPPIGSTAWQPRFSAPGLAETVAAEALALLAANPQRKTISLGTNDSGTFSDEDFEYDNVNVTGYVSVSRAYYTFVNACAELITAQRPDVTIGVLAYRETMEPPPFTLHPSVMPFLTWDRGGWANPERKKLDQELTLRWLKHAERLGWYDYRFGDRMLVPRIDTKPIVEAYRWAREAGVSGVYAECYPNWSEPSKTWIYSRLLWDTEVDTDQLQVDWCTRAVGPAAAPHLINYERRWERTWAKTVVPTATFRLSSLNLYMYYSECDYLQSIDESKMAEAGRDIAAVVAKAETPAQRYRADLFRRIFEYQQASVLSYPKQVRNPRSPKDALELFDTTISTLDRNIELAARRRDMADYMSRHAMFGRFLKKTSLANNGLDWDGWNTYPIWALAEYLQRHERRPGRVTAAIMTAAEKTSSANVEEYCRLILSAARGEVHSAGENLSFDGPGFDPWLIETAAPPREEIRLDDKITFNGGRSLRYPLGVGAGGISQQFPIAPGSILRSVFRYYTPRHPTAAPVGIRPTWYLYDSKGTRLQQIPGVNHYVADSAGRWNELVASHRIREGVASIRVYTSVVRHRPTLGTLYLDAVQFDVLPPNQ